LEKPLIIIWSPESLKQIEKIKKIKSDVEVKIYFEKIYSLLNDIKKHPFSGIGKPEHLKYKFPPCWSRRINKQDRLIYRIKNKEIQVISLLGHYN